METAKQAAAFLAALAMVVVSVAGIAACTPQQTGTPTLPTVADFMLSPAPDAATPVNDPRAIAVRSARGIAAPVCAAVPSKLSASQANLVRGGVVLARGQIDALSFTPEHFGLLLGSAISDPAIRAGAAVLVAELAAQIGQRLIPPGSTAHAMAAAFLESCGIALGPVEQGGVAFSAQSGPSAADRAVRGYEGTE